MDQQNIADNLSISFTLINKLKLNIQHNQIINKQMSFLKKIMRKISPKDQNQEKKPTMIVMQSNTLGMTVVQQTQQDNSCIVQLTQEQWIDILTAGKLDGMPYNRIYFSFLKGIPNFMRMKIWLMLCTQNSSRNYTFCGQMQKKLSQQIKIELKNNQGHEDQEEEQHKQKGLFSVFTIKLYKKLTTSKPPLKQSQQIEKDIKRTYSYKIKFLYTEGLMRKILYALSNSGVQYTQGMNYILLYVIIFCLESLGLNQKNFQGLSLKNERNIFIILREIVLRLEQVFNYQQIFKVLKDLQEKISQSVPDVFYNIHKLGMDTYSLFAQNYYSLLTYSDPPDELTKQMIDLFFLQSDKAITSMIVRMLQISKEEILKIKDAETMQQFVKRDMFHHCFKTLSQQKVNAKTISDFGISFYQNVDKC